MHLKYRIQSDTVVRLGCFPIVLLQDVVHLALVRLVAIVW